MKKIILIEDRVNRQKKVLGAKYEEFESLVLKNIFKNIQGGKDFDEIIEHLNNSKFGILPEYDIIIFHRSAFSNEIRNKLLEFARNHKKTVVSFSGGISSIELSTQNSFTFLLMNVNEFYHNLLDFLTDEEKNIYKLAFGKQWRINLLYEGVEKLTKFLHEQPNDFKKPYSAFETSIPNTFIKQHYFNDVEANQRISKNELEEIVKKIANDLNQSI